MISLDDKTLIILTHEDRCKLINELEKLFITLDGSNSYFSLIDMESKVPVMSELYKLLRR